MRDPIAGPELVFQREIQAACESALEQLDDEEIGVHVEQLGSLYADGSLEVVTDLRPLAAVDRELLRRYCARYNELRDRLSLPSHEPDPVLEKAFWQLGWSKSLEYHK